MIQSVLASFTAQIFACAVATFLVLLAALRLARRFDWRDDGGDAPERKRQTQPVALVGGIALVATLALELAWRGLHGFEATFGSDWSSVVPSFAWSPRVLVAALLLAFATGFVDDVRTRGLGPLAKLVGQACAATAFAAAVRIQGDFAPAWAFALLVCAALVAQNVANAFDHADGALTTVALLGLGAAQAPFVGALAAFLPFNVLRARGGDTPRAYLGDAGSHLLGLVLLTSPYGVAALALPTLDFARVCFERARAGVPLWRGDRRHLAHRLQRADRTTLAICARIALLASPVLVALLGRLHGDAPSWTIPAALVFTAVLLARVGGASAPPRATT